MRAGLLFLSGALLLAGVGCGPDPRAKAELATLQGKWLVVEDDGSIDPTTHYVIEGDKVRRVCVDSVGNGFEFQQFKLRMKPGRSPKRLDLQAVGPGGENLTTITKKKSYYSRSRTKRYVIDRHLTPCIYKLEGDTLTICMGNAANDRPTAFDLAAHPRSLVLKRAPAN